MRCSETQSSSISSVRFGPRPPASRHSEARPRAESVTLRCPCATLWRLRRDEPTAWSRSRRLPVIPSRLGSCNPFNMKHCPGRSRAKTHWPRLFAVVPTNQRPISDQWERFTKSHDDRRPVQIKSSVFTYGKSAGEPGIVAQSHPLHLQTRLWSPPTQVLVPAI